MTARFEKATNALIQAFFKGTLAKGTCAACAVGNIVADAQGGVVKIGLADQRTGGFGLKATCTTQNTIWSQLFMTAGGIQRTWCGQVDREKISAHLFELTGYSSDELAQVEYVFETNTQLLIESYHRMPEQKILEDQYNGLCAAFDVLMELDGIKDETQKTTLKLHPKMQLA